MFNYYAPFYDRLLMSNGNHDRESAIRVTEQNKADMVSFGRLLLANPNLSKRLELDAPLNKPDPDTFYGGGAEGYEDYPFLEEEEAEH